MMANMPLSYLGFDGQVWGRHEVYCNVFSRGKCAFKVAPFPEEEVSSDLEHLRVWS